MTRIYLTVATEPYEPELILGAFTSRDKALDRAKESLDITDSVAEGYYGSHVEVWEFEANDPTGKFTVIFSKPR